jgi:acyl-coenzyme A synthetase/AMP-(fatty) acid ligase
MSFYQNIRENKSGIAAINEEGSFLSYKELSGFSHHVSSVVHCRSLIFVLCENTIGSFAGCSAFLNNRIVPLLLDASIDRQLIRSLIDTYKPDYLYLPDRFRGEFPDFTPCLHLYGYFLLKTGYSMQPPVHDDLALLLSTSGSTGSPKLVRQSYKNLESNGAAIVSYLGIGPDERPITTMPMQYTFGFSIINSHLMAGATVLLTTRTLVEKGFWDFFRAQNATSFGGVPYTFEMLKKLRFFGIKLPSLKTITQAGGKLSLDLSREFAEYAASRGIRFFVMYGQTEATARMSYLPPEYGLSKCGSIGIAIPGGEFFLVDGNGMVIEDNEQEGELAYRGENVTMGYSECRDDLTKGDESGGVLLTGDIARRDQDGFYYITGRKKRFIKLFGNRVNLDEAETLIKGLVPECACCGSDDQMLIFVTAPGIENEVRQYISARLGIHHSAFSVNVIDEIPKNQSGKTSYSGLIP